jgi:FAD/FMN-containing dehydrogenase/Fe-S oxidoreductase
MKLPVIGGSSEDPLDNQRRVLAKRLAERGVSGEIHLDSHLRGLYATDASIYEVEPLAVITPACQEDLLHIAAVCSELSLPVMGRGAGTSLAGQTVGQAVIVDCSVHLSGHGDVETGPGGASSIWVEPGLVLDELCRVVSQQGLTFGPNVSTSTHATLGGMIMNCSAGSHSLTYGMTDEHLLAVELVLPDGRCVLLEEGASERDPVVAELTRQVAEIILALEEEIDARFPRIRRNVGGYALDDLLEQFRLSTPGTHDRVNLARLVCGSEGTLGLLKRARLNLVELPRSRELVLACYSTVDEAMEAVVPILQCAPAAVELMDRNIIDAAALQPIFSDHVAQLADEEDRLPGAVLFVEWFHDRDDPKPTGLERLQQVQGNGRLVPIVNPSDARWMWSIRNIGLGLISKADGTTIPMPGIEDCAVPVEQLASFRRAIEDMLALHGRAAVFYAHASVGLLHIRPRVNVAEASERADFEAIGREALELVLAHGGSISGEHGDGRIRSKLVRSFYGTRLVESFGRIKAVFDPGNLMNPGNKVFERAPMEDLRGSYEPGHEATPSGRVHAYPSNESLAIAAGGCNGNGLCRRLEGGAMCPSYRATREERHSTRGRANALALAMRDGGSLDDPALEETLSLCLACKACRHECPSNVDVSRMKSEYLARKWERTSPPLRERVLGKSFFKLNRFASRWHWLTGPIAGCPPLRRLAARVLGIAPERGLPRFTRSLQSRVGTNPRPVSSDVPTVVLFPDCFTNCNEPENGLAAIEVLESFGYRVVVPDFPVCCGRVAISGGFLDDASKLIARTAQPLRALCELENAVAVVVLEPSCASALQQEWRELPLGESSEHAEVVSNQAFVLEQFLLEKWQDHPVLPRFEQDDGAQLLVHQHCHQKAISETLARLLERCFGRKVDLLDSGCCGMAGSFGFRREHYELSTRIAEQSLGEKLATREGTLIAPGTSCRHQVRELFSRDAVHPAICLRDGLSPLDQNRIQPVNRPTPS